MFFYMYILSYHGSIRQRGYSNLPLSLQTRLRSMAGHDLRLRHLAPSSSPTTPSPSPPLLHSRLPLLFVPLLPCLGRLSTLCCPLFKLTTQSFLCSVFPLSLLVFLCSMRGNFHCSLYPRTGFHCGNAAKQDCSHLLFTPSRGRGALASLHPHAYFHKHTPSQNTHTSAIL